MSSTLDLGLSTPTQVHGFIFDPKCKDLSRVAYHVSRPHTSTPSTQKLDYVPVTSAHPSWFLSLVTSAPAAFILNATDTNHLSASG